MKINPRIEAWCHEYMLDFNGARAARDVGYSKNRARVTAAELLGDADVQKYLKSLTEKKYAKMEITANRVLQELACMAFHDVADYYKKDENGKEVLKPLRELTREERAAICEYDYKAKTIKLAPKDSSLDKLGRHLKLFTELHELKHTFTMMGNVKINGKEIVFNVGNAPIKKP